VSVLYPGFLGLLYNSSLAYAKNFKFVIEVASHSRSKKSYSISRSKKSYSITNGYHGYVLMSSQSANI